MLTTLKTMLVEHYHHEDCVRFVVPAHRRRAYRYANTLVVVVALWGGWRAPSRVRVVVKRTT